MDTILEDASGIKGVIYLIEHTASGKKYVGQTLSHRLNHGKYRPFGAEARFREHKSAARNNTKTTQCTYLYNAIRHHGEGAFTMRVLEVCECDVLDDREKHYISTLTTLFPTGYNLTVGGRTARYATVANDTPLNPPRKRGGCTFRSAETRQKMSERAKAFSGTDEMKEARAVNAKAQHAAAKAARFAGLSVNHSKVDDYINRRHGRIVVEVNGVSATFTAKGESEEESRERAREFLLTLPATLPNCSGNP